MYNTSCLQAPQTGLNPGIGQAQVDNETDFSQMGHGIGSIHRRSSGGDNRVLCFKRSIDTVFDGIEAVNAVLRNNFPEKFSCLLLNHQIRINKALPEHLGQNNADRALPAARHPD